MGGGGQGGGGWVSEIEAVVDVHYWPSYVKYHFNVECLIRWHFYSFTKRRQRWNRVIVSPLAAFTYSFMPVPVYIYAAQWWYAVKKMVIKEMFTGTQIPASSRGRRVMAEWLEPALPCRVIYNPISTAWCCNPPPMFSTSPKSAVSTNSPQLWWIIMDVSASFSLTLSSR